TVELRYGNAARLVIVNCGENACELASLPLELGFERPEVLLASGPSALPAELAAKTAAVLASTLVREADSAR
ncbi:MAG TPA: hypothetical protein VGK73_07805, partial [Polyangiaceae bacterium]